MTHAEVVDDQERRVGGVVLQGADEVAADEAGAAGDEVSHALRH